MHVGLWHRLNFHSLLSCCCIAASSPLALNDILQHASLSLCCPNHQNVYGLIIRSGVSYSLILFSELFQKKGCSSLWNTSMVKLKEQSSLKHNQTPIVVYHGIPVCCFEGTDFILLDKCCCIFNTSVMKICMLTAVLKILGKSPVLLSRPKIWSARASVWTIWHVYNVH